MLDREPGHATGPVPGKREVRTKAVAAAGDWQPNRTGRMLCSNSTRQAGRRAGATCDSGPSEWSGGERRGTRRVSARGMLMTCEALDGSRSLLTLFAYASWMSRLDSATITTRFSDAGV